MKPTNHTGLERHNRTTVTASAEPPPTGAGLLREALWPWNLLWSKF